MLTMTEKVSFMLIVWIFSTASYAQVPTSDEKPTVSCAPGETKCYFGCCPYANATCCLDRYQCCKHGETCIPVVGICISNENHIQPEKSMKIRNQTQNFTTVSDSHKLHVRKTECSSKTTQCGEGCCPYEHATCCSDDLHCCPQNYYCDFETSSCIRNGTEGLEEDEEDFQWCPANMTECGFSSCCPLPEAVCCFDSLFCCPKGYFCDLERKTCAEKLTDGFMLPIK